MDDFEFARRFYGREGWDEWYAHCRGTGFNHGSALVLAVRGPDNVYAAERLLGAAEAAGLIRRTGPSTPTPEQQFLGVGGFMGKAQRNKPEEYRSAVEFGWEPVPGS